MTYQSARASYNRSLASVKQQEANLSAQKVSRSEYTLLSPMDGVVLKDYSLTPGTMISASTSVAEIADVRTDDHLPAQPQRDRVFQMAAHGQDDRHVAFSSAKVGIVAFYSANVASGFRRATRGFGVVETRCFRGLCFTTGYIG